MKAEKSKIDISIVLAGAATLIGLIAVFIPWNKIDGLHYSNYYLSIGNYHDLATFISGITVPFLSFATIVLLLRTYIVQKQQIEDQETYLAKQSFEQKFFQLLNTHNQIVDAMDLRQNKDKKAIVAVKRDCFKKMYQRLKVRTRVGTDIDNTKKQYDFVQNYYNSDLHHYYRFIYRMLKFIHESKAISEPERYEYAALYRALFTPYELALIFYNGLHPFGVNLYPLLNQYSFLNNFDENLFIAAIHKSEYHDVAFGNWNKKTREENLADWKLLQEKRKAEEISRVKQATKVVEEK